MGRRKAHNLRNLPFSLGLAVAWLAALRIFRTRSRRVIGAGYDEYQRVVSATLWLFGFVAIVALVFRLELARGYLAIALPAGLAGLLISRHSIAPVLRPPRQHAEL